MKNVFLIFTVILFGCSSEKPNELVVENNSNMDTINFRIINNRPLVNQKPEYFNKYYQRFGIAIQYYYQITDSLVIDLDLNGSNDTIVILTPKSLESAEYFDKKNDSLPKRLLVEVLNINGKSKIRNIYQNLISDVGGVLSKYIGIKKTNNGFVLKHEAGSKYTWVYNVEFSVQKTKSITLSKIHKECGYDDETIIKENNYNNYSLDKFNLLDSINANCNCDASWKLLTDKK